MKNVVTKDWFILKKYPHIGIPYNYNDNKDWLEEYVTNPKKVKAHSFLPFIHKPIKERRFRKRYDSDSGELIKYQFEGNEQVRYLEDKKRELYYSSQLDSLIYSYYSCVLSSRYEKQLQNLGLSEYITAYRSVPKNSDKPEGSKKCNIDFAKDVFDNIKLRSENSFSVIALDIKGFFDNLDHSILRDKWKELLNLSPSEKLPLDHFNVFKSLTRFNYVDIVDLFEQFKSQIFVKDSSPHTKEKFKRKAIQKIKFMYEHEAVSFCTKEDFLKVQSKLLKNKKHYKDENGQSNLRVYGIPQGSPLSCVLANIYMLDFDTALSKYVKNIGGFYRRYSDDIALIVPNNSRQKIIDYTNLEIKKIKLEIKSSKNQIFEFKKSKGTLSCGQIFKNCINWNKNFIYLGFEFDGKIIKIKSSGLSRFYRKMKRSVNRGFFYATSSENNKYYGELFKNRLYKKFTHIGAGRKRKWLLNKTLNRYEPSDFYDWGNFLTYSYKAAKIMESETIRKQIKGSWKLLHELMKIKKTTYNRVDGPTSDN